MSLAAVRVSMSAFNADLNSGLEVMPSTVQDPEAVMAQGCGGRWRFEAKWLGPHRLHVPAYHGQSGVTRLVWHPPGRLARIDFNA